MKSGKLRQYLAKFSQFLFWTPANLLLSAAGHISSSALFRTFQKDETFSQLKVVLIGVVGFTTVLGVTLFPLRTTEYDLPSAGIVHVQYYSLAVAVGHVLLVILAILGQKLVIFHRPYVLAVISYVFLIPLMTSLIFTGQLLNARLYLTTISMMYIVATLYFQESFVISLFIWMVILNNSSIYLVRHSEVEQVRLFFSTACKLN